MSLDWLEAAATWSETGRQVALAILVDVAGSSPRSVGAVMAVRDDGLMFGSISGGCVEGEVVRACLEALRTGEATVLEFGPSELTNPWTVGLTCGGSIRVWVTPWPWQEPPPTLLAQVRAAHAQRMSVSLPMPLASPQGGSVLPLNPPIRLLIVGAVHITATLVGLATAMGYETVVIDPRCSFAVLARFAVAPTSLIPDWPQVVLPQMIIEARTCCIALTHDPKIDDPALIHFLGTEARFVGALGGRKSRAEREVRFAQAGLDAQQIARLRQPVGLDIGSRGPEEIAAAILAEIVQVV